MSDVCFVAEEAAGSSSISATSTERLWTSSRRQTRHHTWSSRRQTRYHIC